MNIVRKDSEIDKLRSDLLDRMDEGESKYPGMSYEEGCLAVIDWLSGDSDESPCEDD